MCWREFVLVEPVQECRRGELVVGQRRAHLVPDGLQLGRELLEVALHVVPELVRDLSIWSL